MKEEKEDDLNNHIIERLEVDITGLNQDFKDNFKKYLFDHNYTGVENGYSKQRIIWLLTGNSG